MTLALRRHVAGTGVCVGCDQEDLHRLIVPSPERPHPSSALRDRLPRGVYTFDTHSHADERTSQ
jgi:hypothetical protein